MNKCNNHMLLTLYIVDFLAFGIISNFIPLLGDWNKNTIYLPVAFVVYSLVLFSLIHKFKYHKSRGICYLFLFIMFLLILVQYIIVCYTIGGFIREYKVFMAIYAVFYAFSIVLKLSDISNLCKKIRRIEIIEKSKRV